MFFYTRGGAHIVGFSRRSDTTLKANTFMTESEKLYDWERDRIILCEHFVPCLVGKELKK